MNKKCEHLMKALFLPSESNADSASTIPDNLQDSYRDFISTSRGGYTSDRFFHFFGFGDELGHSLARWNERSLWKEFYELRDTDFIFAEDALGTQFFFDARGNRRAVYMLLPESGQVSLCANTFEDFVEDVILDASANVEARRVFEGFIAKHEFPAFHQLACRVPLLLGGIQDAENLELRASAPRMRVSGQIVQQVKKLKPGTKIRDVRIDYDQQTVVLLPESNWRSFFK